MNSFAILPSLVCLLTGGAIFGLACQTSAQKPSGKTEARSEDKAEKNADKGEGKDKANPKSAGKAEPKGESIWTSDMAAAMKQAAAEKKDLLLDFTGSDWCGWCIKLREEVFDKDEFKAEMTKKLVFVEFDFPNDKSKLDAKTQKQNKEWMDKLGVEGFPTIYLTDAQGVPYAKTGYQPGGPTKYIPHLAELFAVRQKRDAALAQAEKVEGGERAKALDGALDAVGEDLAFAHYGKNIDEIIKLDADNKAGLKEKYQQKRNDHEMLSLVSKIGEEFQGDNAAPLIKKLDEAMARLKPSAAVSRKVTGAKISLLSASGKAAEAIKLADALLAEKGLDAEARQQAVMQKVQLLMNLDKADDALKILDEQVASSPAKSIERVQMLMMKVQLAAQATKVDAAKSAMEAAIENAPNDDIKKQLQQIQKRLLRDLGSKDKDKDSAAPAGKSGDKEKPEPSKKEDK